jgi:hypothetical protein
MRETNRKMALEKRVTDNVQFADHEKPVATSKRGYIELGHAPANPMKAIREKCIDCSAGVLKNIASCPINSCALYPFRMGVNPHRKPRTVRADQRAVLAARLEPKPINPADNETPLIQAAA